MDADELYGLPLERFVPERGALAKELRAAGKRDAAAEVAALRKPTVAAWAVNQLIRTQRKLVDKLLAAGDALRGAQENLLAGSGDARKLRQASEGERAALEALVERGRGLLTDEGDELSAAVLERVSETLHAAALDEDARAQVADGRLLRELRHAGLGFGDVGGVPLERPAKAPPKRKPAAKPKAGASRKEAAAERAAAKEAQEQADAERKAARLAQAAARKRAERAARALNAAQERRDRAAKTLEEADAALDAAREEAEAAATELDSG